MVNFRMDAKLKKNMESVCKDMGLSITTAFTIFATKVTREHRIPFEINSDPFYNKANMEYLSRAASEIDNGTAKLSQRRLLALFMHLSVPVSAQTSISAASPCHWLNGARC